MAHIRSLFFTGRLADIDDAALAAYEDGRPSEVIWNVTSRCNLKCAHCYMGATSRTSERELTPDEALALVDQIGELGVPVLFVTGGEPFLRKDLWTIIERAREHGVKVVVSTNGTLIGDDEAARLAGLGVDYVAVSLYGPEEFHDAYVGVPGAYGRIRAAIERLRDNGIGICVKTTVNSETWPHLFGVIETAKEIGAGVVYPCDLITTGRASDLGAQSVEQSRWRELADHMLEDVLSDGNGLEFDIGAEPSIVPYLVTRLVEKGFDTRHAVERLGVMSACPVGKGLLAVNSDGDILPCNFMQDYYVGNVRDTSLEEATKALFELGEREVTGACACCEYVTLCRGCRAKALCRSGDILAEDPLCLLAAEEG